MATQSASFPGRAAIEAYGNGGFRFAGMSHRGSILCLANSIVAWDVTAAEELTPESLEPVLAEKELTRSLLLGTGARQIFASSTVRAAFREAGIALEVMDTGAACRTYNVLLGEGRLVAAALIAVD
ncbi:MAG: Mth938-like domain-containing protein [Hyphomicrobiaceae bacterium]